MNSNIIKKVIERANRIKSEHTADSQFINTLHSGLISSLTNSEIRNNDKNISDAISKIAYPNSKNKSDTLRSNLDSLLLYIEKIENTSSSKLGNSPLSQERLKELSEIKKKVLDFSQKLSGFEERNRKRGINLNTIKSYTGVDPDDSTFTEAELKNSPTFNRNLDMYGRYVNTSRDKAQEINKSLKDISKKLTGSEEVPRIQKLVDLAKARNDPDIIAQIEKVSNSIQELTNYNRFISETQEKLGLDKVEVGKIDYNRRFIPTTPNVSLQNALKEDQIKSEIGSKAFSNRAQIVAAQESKNEGTQVDIKKLARELRNDPQYKGTYDQLIVQFTNLVKNNDYNKINEIIDTYRKAGDLKSLGVAKSARKAALETKWDTDRSPKVMLLPEEALTEDLDEPILPYATEVINEEGGIDSTGMINSENIVNDPAKKKIIEEKIRRKLYKHRIGFDLSNKIGGNIVRGIDDINPLMNSKLDIKGTDSKLNVLTLLSREIALDLSEEVSRIFDRNVELCKGNIIEARKATASYLELKLKDPSSLDRGVYETVERVKNEYNLSQFTKLTPELLNEVVANASEGLRITLEDNSSSIVPDSILKVRITSNSSTIGADMAKDPVLEIEEEVLARSKIGRSIIASEPDAEKRVQTVVSGKESLNTVTRVQKFVQLPTSDSILETIQRIGLEVEEADSVQEYVQKKFDQVDKYRTSQKDVKMSNDDEELLSALLTGRFMAALDKNREHNLEELQIKIIGKIIGEENAHSIKGVFDLKERLTLLHDMVEHPELIRKILWEKGDPFFGVGGGEGIRTKIRRAVLRGLGLRKKVLLDDGQERDVNVVTFFGRRLFADRVDDFSNTKVAKFFGLDKTLKRDNRKKKNSILELALSIVVRAASTLVLKVLKRIPVIKNIVEKISTKYNSFMTGEGGKLLNKSLATVKVAGTLSSAAIAGIQRGAIGGIIGGIVFGPVGGIIGGTVFGADGIFKALRFTEGNIYVTPLMKQIDSWFGAELARNQLPGISPQYVNKFTKGNIGLGDMLRKDKIYFDTAKKYFDPVSGRTVAKVIEHTRLNNFARLFEMKGPIGVFMRGLRVMMSGRYSTLLALGKSGLGLSLADRFGRLLNPGTIARVTGTISSSMVWGTIGYIIFGSNPLAGLALFSTKVALDTWVSPFIKNTFSTARNAFNASLFGRRLSAMFRLPVFESLGLGAGVYTVIDTVRTILDPSLTGQQKWDILLNPINLVTGGLNIFGYVSAFSTIPTIIQSAIANSSIVARIFSKITVGPIGAPALVPIKVGMAIGSVVGGLVGLLFFGGGPAAIMLGATVGAIVGGVAAGIVSIFFPPAGIAVIVSVGAAGGLAGGFLGGAIGRGIDNMVGAAGNLLKLIGIFLGVKKFFGSRTLKDRMAAILQLTLSMGGLGVATVVVAGAIVPIVTPGILVPLQTNTTAVKSYEKLISPNTLLYSIAIKKGVDFSDPKVQNINLNFIDEMDQTKISSITLLGAGSSNVSLSSNGKSLIYKYTGALKQIPFETIQYQVNLTSPLKDMNVPNGLCNALTGSSNVTFDGKAAVDTQINQNICIDKDGKELKQTKGNRTSFVDNAGLPVSADKGSVTQCSYAIGGGGSHSTYKAIDIGAPSGTPVTPPLNGVVRLVSYQPEGYGLYIKVEHIVDAGKMETTYGHLSKVNVSVGDTVTSKTVIGEVGTTGNSTGNHLHFETHINGAGVEPCCVIDCSQYKTYSLNNALSCTNKSSAFYTDSRTQCNF